MAIVKRENKVQKPTKETTQEETQTPETSKEETKEVAVKETAAPPIVSDGVEVPTIKSLENAIDPVDLGTMLRRAVGASGGIVLDNKVNFGEYIDVQIVSTSARHMVTPVAEMSDKDARKLCRASYDGGLTIPGFDGGPPIPVEDWIEEMKKAGYEANSVSKYLDIFGIIFSSDKNQDKIDDAELVQISVSPTAVRIFNAFIMQIPLKVARGQIMKSHQNCIRVVAEAVTGDFNYTVLKFQSTPLSILENYIPVIA